RMRYAFSRHPCPPTVLSTGPILEAVPVRSAPSHETVQAAATGKGGFMMPGPGRKPKKKGRARKGTGAIWEYKPGRFRGLLDLGIGPDGKLKRGSGTGGSGEEGPGMRDGRE